MSEQKNDNETVMCPHCKSLDVHEQWRPKIVCKFNKTQKWNYDQCMRWFERTPADAMIAERGGE